MSSALLGLPWEYVYFLLLLQTFFFPFTDGSFLAVGSHDNFIYIYSVTEGGRRYTRCGKCTVSHACFSTLVSLFLCYGLFNRVRFSVTFTSKQVILIACGNLFTFFAVSGSLKFHHTSWLVQRWEVYHVEFGRLWNSLLWVLLVDIHLQRLACLLFISLFITFSVINRWIGKVQ